MGAELYLTDLGNAFVASVVAAVVMAWLWGRLGWLMGLVFAICFGGVWLSVLGLKLISHDLAPPVRNAAVFGLSQGAPSGHIALAATVFGCAAVIFLTLDRKLVGLAGASASLGALLTVAVTRVTLHTHTVGDVLAGLALAGIGVWIFERALRVRGVRRPVAVGGLLLAMTAAAMLALVSGVRVSSTDFL
jgi:membrane-associated phospholipid phosphatase